MTNAEIQQEIERTRARLGETVDELAAKADVRARARAKATEMKARAAEVSGRVQSQAMQRRWPAAVAADALVVGAAVLIWRRRRG